MGSVVDRRDRWWLIGMAIWSVVLWPVAQNFAPGGQAVRVEKPIVASESQPDQDRELARENEKPELSRRAEPVDSFAEATVPRTVSDGPGIGNLDRVRQLGKWVRHGNEDWEWVPSGVLKVRAIGGSWLLSSEKAVWMPE